jgi:hypothetical protein
MAPQRLFWQSRKFDARCAVVFRCDRLSIDAGQWLAMGGEVMAPNGHGMVSREGRPVDGAASVGDPRVPSVAAGGTRHLWLDIDGILA